jgi:linoleate 10R-lipoxygenase
VDPDYFPNPHKVDITCPVEKYSHFGWGPHMCFGGEILNAGLTGMLRTFARLPNLRRAPGPEGRLKYVVMGPFRVYLAADWSSFSPWPTSLFPLRWELILAFKMHYDG